MPDGTSAPRSREQIERDYEVATRNYTPTMKSALEANPREQPGDSDQLKHAKRLYRELTPHIASGGNWENNGFHNRA